MSQLEQKPKKKKKKPPKLEFDAGKVFDPAGAKDEDLELNLDSARYKARKGQGGDRRG